MLLVSVQRFLSKNINMLQFKQYEKTTENLQAAKTSLKAESKTQQL